ncbi:hypothetical protein M673_23640 (plasmid) [Aureimonas sp. AU20]|nr:hypothetical protein M673_23640 [Aureimonas sp. AU20]
MFEPWIGKSFGVPNVVGGCRLLILGESHYTKDLSKVGCTPAGFTSDVVEGLGIHGRHAFFGKLHEIVTGLRRGDQSPEDKIAFWNSVAFYNYVPVLVDGRDTKEGGAGRRPTDAMFKAGAESFQSIRREINPDAVIVCGLTLWDYLAPTLNQFEGPPRDVIYYDDGDTLYARIQHPSWAGFTTDKWYYRIHRLIEMTAEPRQAGRREVWTKVDG